MNARRLALAGLCALVLPSGSAQAHPASSAWSANHTLSCHFGCGPDTGVTVGEGDIVALWQQVTYADGFLPALCGSTGVDGRFGLRTHQATHNWQQYMSSYATSTIVETLKNATQFYVDGIVGPQTWSLARSRLVLVGYDPDTVSTVYYYPGIADREFYVYDEFRIGGPQVFSEETTFEPFTSSYSRTDTNHPAVTYPTC